MEVMGERCERCAVWFRLAAAGGVKLLAIVVLMEELPKVCQRRSVGFLPQKCRW